VDKKWKHWIKSGFNGLKVDKMEKVDKVWKVCLENIQKVYLNLTFRISKPVTFTMDEFNAK
jgi:hypothetical protein